MLNRFDAASKQLMDTKGVGLHHRRLSSRNAGLYEMLLESHAQLRADLDNQRMQRDVFEECVAGAGACRA